MRTAFIIHGSYGNPDENWFPWLKKELQKNGYRVFVPQFPIPEPNKQNISWGGHNLGKWMETFGEYNKYINDKTIFIAHSRGCIFLYHYLSTLQFPVSAVFLVAPWLKYRWYPKNWNKIDSFHETPFRWKNIKKASLLFYVFQSTNDEIPVSEGRKIADKLDAEFVLVENAGHFNTRSGFVTFPDLLERIL